jgi:hypothetical protein
MKKLLIVLLALTVIGVFAFAQDEAPAAKLSVGGWGRMWVTPLASDGTNQTVTAGPGWANNGARVSVSFDGSSEHFGFDWNPGVSNNSMTAVCDQAKIWAKINPMLTVQVGQIQGDVLRGKLDDFGDVIPADGKDNIFQRFYPKTGILLDITPVDGLYLGVALDVAGTAKVDNSSIRALYVASGATQAQADAAYPDVDAIPAKLSDAYKAIQVGAGYTIKDVGMFRAQYIGSAVDKGGVIQAAFAYTGMEGLTVDVGAKYPLNSDTQMHATAAAAYAKDALSVYGRVDANFAGVSGAKFNTDVALQGYYTVADPVAIGVEGSLTGMSAVDGGDAKVVDVMPAIKLGYSNGYLKVGFDAKIGLDDQDFAYQLPILLEYWF